ncbi:D-alanyl-D-alanine carboxypeptidase [Limnoraphis robusta]|uniref:D-alanyl-D-alanine carboxypeptidase n=1 Tax=Limnoraphis robusta CCNP1315 TaxID=3110306 RepID=A0ABU5U0W1_9CYAN|nr:D-alanyl-D-alanine carboxypeptidase [Limnoraphis robusta]MEA5519778.1 D-alanyl-D-alanine carboxypeptidase [Limnoraphis robusta CCNP1315]MEA5549074.1 D-alanyl-D-alanine carboxypeptidase [Limnoraphis robusta CCNP1324]
MLDVFSSGVLSVWLEMAGVNKIELNAATRQVWEGGLSKLILLDQPDPIAASLVEQYLNRLAERGLSDQVQGVWIQAGPISMASNVGTTPLPAASITKVATSLAALQQWTPDYQFETLIAATGPVENGVVQGDLVVVGSGDPFFVWEEGFALGNTLNQMGITQVTGNLIIAGNFSMNYESNPMKAGEFLKQALDSRLWPAEAAAQYDSRMPPGTPRPIVAIAGTVQPQYTTVQASPLVRHKSLPLAEIIKQMNIYSNNLMSEMLAQSVGGAAVVRERAAMAAGVSVDEIQIINGSGLGHENQISARAAVAMFMALQQKLDGTNLNVADLFPVSGRDIGTLEFRNVPRHSAVKTGSLFDVSALAGAIPTRDRGVVWFAIINRGTGLDDLRDQQDWLLQQLVSQWGTPATLPPAISPHIDGRKPFLGDMSRNEIL